MECIPVANEVMLNVATPLAFSCVVPKLVAPSRNVTIPVATLLPVWGETVAVKVTLCPVLIDAAEDVSTVLVARRVEAMVTVTASDVEAVSPESPP
jgi:hypothetical protein